jgi:hypothetical protein
VLRVAAERVMRNGASGNNRVVTERSTQTVGSYSDTLTDRYLV